MVFETQILEKLKNYSVKGTVHIILNNQVGVISSQKYSRSTFHPSNISNINQNFQIFVNAQNPDAVDSAIKLAIEYRQTFGRDVFVELIGFRRDSHFSDQLNDIYHPLTSKKIQEIPAYHVEYEKQLLKDGILSKSDVEEFLKGKKEFYQSELEKAKKGFIPKDYYLEMVEQKNKNKRNFTYLTEGEVKPLHDIFVLPENFTFHPIVVNEYKKRLQSIE